MAVHCSLSAPRSASARTRSSRSSKTLRSCAAIAIMNSFASAGGGMVGVSTGVGGTEYEDAVVGVGRDRWPVGGAMGRVSDRRFVVRQAPAWEHDGRAVESGPIGARGGMIGAGGASSLFCVVRSCGLQTTGAKVVVATASALGSGRSPSAAEDRRRVSIAEEASRVVAVVLVVMLMAVLVAVMVGRGK